MSLLRRTLFITLSLLMLVSSIGLSVGLHMCSGALQDMALFHKAEACSMEHKQQPPACHGEADDQDHNTGNDCCQDSLIVIDGIDDAMASKAQISLKQSDLPSIAAFQQAVCILHMLQVEAPVSPTLSYAAPPIVRDIPVLLQSFLI
ncbi:MAG: hypothetical protein KY428_05435 [Bacteroidetes bacterium]|nr:hypothetical protein [Bacteroidota bacterium]